MFHLIPTIASLSDMRIHPNKVLAKAKQSPVILLERGSKPALVVMSPDLWNHLVEKIECLEDAVAIYQTKWELETGQDELITLSAKTMSEWAEDGNLSA